MEYYNRLNYNIKQSLIVSFSLSFDSSLTIWSIELSEAFAHMSFEISQSSCRQQTSLVQVPGLKAFVHHSAPIHFDQTAHSSQFGLSFE